MKSSIVQMILPMAAFVLASAGAVTTSAHSKSGSELVLVDGFIHTPGPCTPAAKCNDSGSQACMVDYEIGPQIFGKAQGETACLQTLYRP